MKSWQGILIGVLVIGAALLIYEYSKSKSAVGSATTTGMVNMGDLINSGPINWLLKDLTQPIATIPSPTPTTLYPQAGL